MSFSVCVMTLCRVFQCVCDDPVLCLSVCVCVCVCVMTLCRVFQCVCDDPVSCLSVCV